MPKARTTTPTIATKFREVADPFIEVLMTRVHRGEGDGSAASRAILADLAYMALDHRVGLGWGGHAAVMYLNERGERAVYTYAQLLHGVARRRSAKASRSRSSTAHSGPRSRGESISPRLIRSRTLRLSFNSAPRSIADVMPALSKCFAEISMARSL